MSYGKFVALVSTRCGTYKRFVALDDDAPLRAGKPSFKLVALEEDALRFDTSGDAKRAAVIVVNTRSGKPLTGGLTEVGVRQLAPDPARMDGFMEFFRELAESIVSGKFNTPGTAQFLEAFQGAGPAPERTSPAEPAAVLDWQAAGEELYAALAVIIDQVDYTNQACTSNEPIGGVLEPRLLANAKTALSAWLNLRIKDRSRSGDGVGG
jgi:hypothetical protein